MSGPGRLAKLRWLAARLQAMPPAEIVHRVREAAVKRRWRKRVIGWDAAIADGPLHASPLLRERLATAAAIPAVRESRDRTISGSLRFFGRNWPRADWAAGAGAAFWLHDPIGGQLWPGPEVSFLAVDARATSDRPGSDRGDAKFVWEPGRLQILHALAACAAQGDTEAAATALAILRDFARTNPPYGGIHWVSGIEISLRLVSLVLLVSALTPERIAVEDRRLIRRLAAAHGHHLAAFPSLYSSANNHRVAEGLGLFLAGLLAPDLGAAWAVEGRQILETEALLQILPDGGGAEQSVVYQAFTMEMVGFAALLAAESGRPLAASVLDRLGQGASFLRSMLDCGGSVPMIGDDDETRVIAQPPDREPRYVASVTAAIAGLTGRPELLPPGRDPHLRDALFAAPPGSRPWQQGSATFADVGYSTVHDVVAGRRVDLVFDHGRLGYLGLSAHGHADALALWLSIDGIQVLIDAGTYLYHSGGSRRLELRESLHHNGLNIGQVSHSRASSAFGWSSRAEARLEADEARGPGQSWAVAGSHDGYRRRFGIRHRRGIAREADAIVVTDRLIGSSGPTPVEIHFLLPRTLEAIAEPCGVTVTWGGTSLCRIEPPDGFTVAIRRGGAENAVRSPRFGEIEDAQRIVMSGTLASGSARTRIVIVNGPSISTEGRGARSAVTSAE